MNTVEKGRSTVVSRDVGHKSVQYTYLRIDLLRYNWVQRSSTSTLPVLTVEQSFREVRLWILSSVKMKPRLLCFFR